jgi:hypothetical protein
LAYILGLEGIALLRAFAGEYDRDFTMARLAEVRALLDSAEELGDGAVVDPITTAEGYGSWSEFYDDPGNQLIDLEQPIVREILDGLMSKARPTGPRCQITSPAHLRTSGRCIAGVPPPPTPRIAASLRQSSGTSTCTPDH